MSSEQSGPEVRHRAPVVQFGRQEFLEILHVEDPSMVYREGGVFFFYMVGLKVCTSECGPEDFEGRRFMIQWPDGLTPLSR